MMRSLVVLLAITAASGQVDQAGCALDSARAVDDIMDGLVYIMASIARCDPNTGDQVRCTLDVSAAIESINKMVNIIVKAVDKCGAITTGKPQCGLAIGELTRSLAGLTTASAGIVAKCPNAANGGHPLATVGGALQTAASNAKGGAVAATAKAVGVDNGFSNSFGQCIINVKDSVKSLFKAVKRAMDMAQPSGDATEEAHNAVKLVDAFVGLAQYISGAVSKCSTNVETSVNAGCAQMSASLTHATGEVGVAATRMADSCEPTAAERLYGLSNMKAVTAPTSNSLTITLTALLPITAVVAFVGGKRLAKVRSVEPLSDEEMLVQSE